MLPDRVSNPGPLTYESGALPIALRDPASSTLDGLKGRFCYAATTAKDFKLRFLCDYDDAIAIVLQPNNGAALMLRSCCTLKPLLC